MITKVFNYILARWAGIYRGCRIYSCRVSMYAYKNEKGVEVQNGTSIDKFSRLGSYSYVGENTHITKASIGRYCSIANNVSIGQGEHPLDNVSTSSIFYKDAWTVLTSGECHISSDVWIGVDAVILRGVSIGFGAVIAANAVVTKDVPPFGIVAGVPARLIRYRFSEKIQKAILDSVWWNYDKKVALTIISELEKKLVHL